VKYPDPENIHKVAISPKDKPVIHLFLSFEFIPKIILSSGGILGVIDVGNGG
jgi:hypothetical protein